MFEPAIFLMALSLIVHVMIVGNAIRYRRGRRKTFKRVSKRRRFPDEY